MDRSKARPLQPLELRARPIAHRAISWSCDAELAVATNDTIHVFLPEYLRPGGSGEEAAAAADDDAFQPQFTLTLTTSGIIRADPAINGPLCAFAGVRLAGSEGGEPRVFGGVGSGEATRSGSALGQSLGLEWSPNGLGRNLRPVLSILTTSGSIVTMGEHIESRPAMASSLRSRSFKHWKTLWGLGAQLPIPDGESARGFRTMDERIVSFSWAREVGSGTALLAYMNDEHEVVVMGVQFFSRGVDAGEEESGWDIFEIDRFDGRGPHHTTDLDDGEFVPSGGAFCLKWSPWYVAGEYRTATVAYVAKNHVGFRRVTIQGAWLRGQDPTVRVERSDSVSICTFLSADAFVEWEDAVWPEGESRLARGIIATPFVVKPFQVDLRAHPGPRPAAHSVDDCLTLYPKPEELSTNPITDLIIHHADPSNKPPEPHYSLIRLSATHTNHDWYQTNLPSRDKLPQWAERVRRAVSREVPRVEALGGIDSESDTDSEFDEPEVDMSMMPKEEQEHLSKVHPHRFRLWGMAASPGDGCVATLVSKHVTQHADRRPRSRVLFSWPAHTDSACCATSSSPPPSSSTPAARTATTTTPLTTEATLWESMYGNNNNNNNNNLLDMPAPLSRTTTHSSSLFQETETPLRRQFRPIIPKQTCVFCSTSLTTLDTEATCQKGHSFATCAATGLAILAPGTSRICSVCSLRCLNTTELSRMAARHISPEAVLESLGEACGGCGGKFLI